MDIPEGTGPSVYDGFISYSHAADDLLAPRLQSALQRFAKPWWKRRAVRIFRDESSLSANPHLWSSITEALDTSGWFVLLLSPDAAQSEWVNQEIAYWVEHRDPKKILPVVTDGEFGWADDVMTGSAVPESLQGVFSEEPRWVDVRWAKGEEQLDLQNPDFAAAVADIASAIRGVPKDELASEEVRQHRRTVRTAWGAGVVTAALAVAAIGFGIDARNERNRADVQAGLAQEEATRASNEAERANQLASDEAAARADADASAAEAKRNAQEARARELAASAIGVVDDDPQLAMLLALESFDTLPEAVEPGQELKRALREAVHASSVIELVPVEDPYSYIDLSPNGEVLVISSGTTLRAVQADTFEELWTYEETGPDSFEYVGFSTEGRFVTLTVADQNWFVSNHRQYANVFGEPIDVVAGPDGEPARLLVFDAATGQIAQRLEFGDEVCAPIVVPGSMSDGHGLLAVGLDKCDFYADSHEAVVYDTATWQIVHRLSAWEGASGVFAASPESNAVMFTSGWTQFEPFGESVALEVGSWKTLHRSDLFTFGAFSPDGSLFAGVNARPNEEYPEWTEGTLALVDTETWKIIHLYKTDDDINHYAVRFSPDGSRIYVGSISGNTTAFSVDRRDLADVYASGEAVSLAIGGTEAFMTTTSGTLQRWDTTGILRGELSSNIDDYLGATNGVLVAGESRLLWQFGDFQALSPLNPDGSIGRSEPVLWGSLAPLDGDRVVTFDINHPERTELGPLIEIDLRTGDRQPIAGCFVPIEEAMYGEPLCENGSVHPSGWLFPSLDGLEFINVPLALAGRTEPSEVTVWDGMTFEVTQTVVLDDVGRFYDTLRGILTPDRILLWDAVLSEAVIFDRFTGEQLLATKGDHPFGVDRGGRYLFITDHEAGEVLRVDLATLDVVSFFGPVPARLQSLGISPSGASVAITGEDGFVRIVDAESRALLEVVPLENAAGLGWIDETHVGIGTNDDFWTVITLEVDELTELARSQLVRDFTDEECVLYRLDCGGP